MIPIIQLVLESMLLLRFVKLILTIIEDITRLEQERLAVAIGPMIVRNPMRNHLANKRVSLVPRIAIQTGDK